MPVWKSEVEPSAFSMVLRLVCPGRLSLNLMLAVSVRWLAKPSEPVCPHPTPSLLVPGYRSTVHAWPLHGYLSYCSLYRPYLLPQSLLPPDTSWTLQSKDQSSILKALCTPPLSPTGSLTLHTRDTLPLTVAALYR